MVVEPDKKSGPAPSARSLRHSEQHDKSSFSFHFLSENRFLGECNSRGVFDFLHRLRKYNFGGEFGGRIQSRAGRHCHLSIVSDF